MSGSRRESGARLKDRTTSLKIFSGPSCLSSSAKRDTPVRRLRAAFARGFGTTVGTRCARAALVDRRRGRHGVLLTGLHDSRRPRRVEDATDIILNLKQIPLKLHVDHTKTLYLRVDKKGVVRAKDIEADADVEILEPEANIATVSDGGKLHMELRMKRGRGYVSADKNFDEDLGIGWIPVDSVHSPVKKVILVEAAASARRRLRQADRGRVATARSRRATPCRCRPS